LTTSIAVAGKGGSGKTTIASLVIRYLKHHGSGPILAIDADPNANLAESLGLRVKQTVGAMLDEFQREKIKIPPGITKEAYLEYRLNEALLEGKGLDLVTMGRGEGPECYCYPNLMLRKFVDRLASNYAYVVMDNEAGMEHLSRRTTRDVDEMLLVTDHSVKGARAVARVRELIRELKISVGRESVVVNKVPGEIDPLLREEMERMGLTPTAIIPVDEALLRYDLEQKPLLDLPDTSGPVAAVNTLLDHLLKGKN
jgi:CO dehydrogenase maturation factor